MSVTVTTSSRTIVMGRRMTIVVCIVEERTEDSGLRTQYERRVGLSPESSVLFFDYTFTNFLKSTFKMSPTAMKNIIVAEPPYEISGSGIPVTGRRPICIPTLITM